MHSLVREILSSGTIQAGLGKAGHDNDDAAAETRDDEDETVRKNGPPTRVRTSEKANESLCLRQCLLKPCRSSATQARCPINKLQESLHVDNLILNRFSGRTAAMAVLLRTCSCSALLSLLVPAANFR